MPAPLDLRPGQTNFSWAELSVIAGGDDQLMQASVVGDAVAKRFAEMRQAKGAEYVPQVSAAFVRMLQGKIDANSVLARDPAFKADIERAFMDLVTRAFGAPDTATLSFKHLVQRANNDARDLLRLLDDLEQQALRDAAPPDTEPWPDIPQLGLSGPDGDVSLLQTKPKPETLVLKGGGCKGLGYVMTFKTLAQEGVLSEVRNVVGTSIGAITSTGLACGLSTTDGGRVDQDVSELGTLLSDVCDPGADIFHLFHLAGKPAAERRFETMYPGIGDTLPKAGGLLEGWEVFRTLELTTARSVNQFLRGIGLHREPPVLPPEWGSLTPAEVDRLRLLAGDMAAVVDRTDHMVTFRDLELLSRLAPDKFKNLAVTAWCGLHKETVFLDAKTTPDLPVALAARASMALPKLYAPVCVTYGGQDYVFSDGGVGNNLPIDYGIRLTEPDMDDEAIRGQGAPNPEKDRALAVARSKVLALAFDESGGAYTTLHEPVKAGKASLFRRAFLRTVGQDDYSRAQREDRERLHAHGSRHTLVVPHDGVGTVSFFALKRGDTRQRVYIASLANTLKFLDTRENQGYQLTVGAEELRRDAGTLSRRLPDAQKRALRRHMVEEFGKLNPGAPDLDPLTREVRLRHFIAPPPDGAPDVPPMPADLLRRFIAFPPGQETRARETLLRLWDDIPA